MNGFFNVSSSPHVRSEDSTGKIMYNVALALIPAAAFGVYRFGWYAAAVMVTAIVFAVLSEYTFQMLTKQKATISDGSALVTGLLLGMNLPPEVPLWIPALGSIFAIVFVKQFFGGIGQNFMNPAMAARCFLITSFAGIMGNFQVDGTSGATPLAAMRAGERVDLAALFTGFTTGCIGEVSALAILVGGIYLLARKIISWHIPVCYLGTFLIFQGIFGGHGVDPVYLLAQLFGGGLLLAAFFMATDYVSSPITVNGKILFGVLLGILTGVFRIWGTSPGGVSYAVVFANLLVPLIEKITMPKAFGFKPGDLEGKKKISPRMFRPAITLTGITLIAGLALGGVYQVTKGPIERAELEARAKAFEAVCPQAESFGAAEDLEALIAENTDETGSIWDGKFGNISYDSVYAGLDADGKVIGHIINVTSKEGFGGEITVSVGVSADGEVTGMEFLTINETAGLGMRASEPEFMNQYIGKTTDEFELTKTAASSDNEIQAVSGATITSGAVTNAVNAALCLAAGASE